MAYRTEHPKPQFMRDDWTCLNGTWDFAFDPGISGEARGMQLAEAAYTHKIEVPFCPESRLSGIGNIDYMYSVWYRRRIRVTAAQLKGRVLLHFGAVDYRAKVFFNGTLCGTHKGGYSSFTLDVTDFLQEGENLLVVNAEDNVRDPMIPSGKQCDRYASNSCLYTRTTGIWQTVWLEFVPETHLRSVIYHTDVQTGTVTIEAKVSGAATLSAAVSYKGKPMGSACVAVGGEQAVLSIPLKEIHLWEPGHGRLYDVELTYGIDHVKSYFGLRSVRMDGYKFMLNEKSVFQRLVLHQGFYPEGIYTAPSEEALEKDIDLSLALGFNGARLHEKVFEERYLYHCDRKGYMVWGEFPDWGINVSRSESVYPVLSEWIEVLARDRNHPSIIGWCPFNETWDNLWRKQYDDMLALVYKVTKAIDPSRPCIDTSGCYHVMTDIFDVHNYTQDPKELAACYDSLVTDGTITDVHSHRQTYKPGTPIFVSEYGGIGYAVDGTGWSYGDNPKTAEEFYTRLRGLTEALMNNPCLFGYCYTQLTDVEQEQNGLYTYDRQPKFDVAVLKDIFGGKAAIEA